MNIEYLLFNLCVISGPLVLSFKPKYQFINHWKAAFGAIVITAIPFLIWDAAVSGKHWWFNYDYTMDIRIAGLPPGEWLFFLTVPFACLFTWEALPKSADRISGSAVRNLLLAVLPIGIFCLIYGKGYTGLMVISLSLTAMLDAALKTALFEKKETYCFLAVVTGFILVFNGYLTARPVVLYGESYQLGFRIFTIPIEDFGYGFSLLLSTVAIYEKLKLKI